MLNQQTIFNLCYNYIALKEKITIEQVKLYSLDEIALKARGYFFDFDYELFDDSYKEHLETSFIKYFFLYEIGFDTFQSFKNQLTIDWQLKIIAYNKYYKTNNLIDEEVLSTVNMTATSKNQATSGTQSTSNAQSSNNANSGSQGIYSDYAQTVIDELDYATSGTNDTSQSNATTNSDVTQNSESNGSSQAESKNTGYSGYPASMLLQQYRNTILQVDLLFFNDLSDLFIGVY